MTGNEEPLEVRIRAAIEAKNNGIVDITFGGGDSTAFPLTGFASLNEGTVWIYGPKGRAVPRRPADIGQAEAAGIIAGPRGARPEVRNYLREEAGRHAQLSREIRGKEVERHFKRLGEAVGKIETMFEGGTAPGAEIDAAEAEAYREFDEMVERVRKFRDAAASFKQVTGHGAMTGTGPEEAEVVESARRAIEADAEAVDKLYQAGLRLVGRADYFAVRTARA